MVRRDPIDRVFAEQPHQCGHYEQERVETEYDGLLSEKWRCAASALSQLDFRISRFGQRCEAFSISRFGASHGFVGAGKNRGDRTKRLIVLVDCGSKCFPALRFGVSHGCVPKTGANAQTANVSNPMS